jgi:ribosome biogenesis protein Nip4
MNRIRCFYGGTKVLEAIHKFFKGFLSMQEVKDLLNGYTPLICEGVFMEAYLLSKDVLETVNILLQSGRVPYSAGIYVGRLRRKEPSFIPSTDFLQYVYSSLGRILKALVIGGEGIKPFLYGKDVLKASVRKCIPPIKKSDIVSIVGEDQYVYGLGLSTIGSCDEISSLKRTDPVAINVFDVGWYLRGGTEARERKYRIE